MKLIIGFLLGVILATVGQLNAGEQDRDQQLNYPRGEWLQTENGLYRLQRSGREDPYWSQQSTTGRNPC